MMKQYLYIFGGELTSLNQVCLPLHSHASDHQCSWLTCSCLTCVLLQSVKPADNCMHTDAYSILLSSAQLFLLSWNNEEVQYV